MTTDRLSLLANDLKPYITRWINAAIQGGGAPAGGGGGSLAAHALDGAYHTGTLADSQAPQFPLLAGGRTFTADIALLDGLTVDGVDVSEHAANASAHHNPVTAGNTAISVAGQAVSLALNAVASGLEISSGLRIADAIAGAGLTITSKILAVGGGDGITVNANDVALTTPGSLSVSSANNAAGNHTHAVTASSDVSAGVAALLKSTAAGGLTLAALGVKGNVDITDGGDLTVGSNVLFVDVSQNSVGIGGQAPDPQFALDVNGPIRGTEIVGKHALQLKDVLFLAHYDGGYPYYTNFTGDLNSVVGGMVPSEVGNYTIRPGKFYKGIVFGKAATNLIANPSLENATTGWSINNDSGGDLAVARVANDSWVGTYCAKLTSTTLNNSSFYTTFAPAVGDGVQSYSASLYMRAAVPTSVLLRLQNHYSPYTPYADNTVSVTTEWQRFYVTGIPANGESLRFSIRPVDAGVDIYIDAIQVEAGTSPSAYVDGSLGSGYSWSGTAHASTSSRAGNHYLAYNNIQIGRAFSVMAWVRPEGNPGATSTFEAAYALKIDTNNRLSLELRPSGEWRLTRIVAGSTAYMTMSGGDAAWQTWQHHCTVYNGVNTLTHYIDGIEVYTETLSTGFVFGATWELDLANDGYSNYYGNFTLDDVAIVGRALTANEVRAIYESDAPVFAESSQKVFRATQRGLVWADEEGLWMRDYSGNAVLGAYGGEAATKSWGGLSLGVGDILIGRSPDGYLHWDDSANTLNVSGVINITGGSGYANLSDKPTLGALAAKNSVDLATGEVTNKTLDNVADGSTYKRVTANEKTGAGRAYTGLNSSGQLVTKVLPGSNVGTPGGAGLYLGADYLGYYNGSAWKTYLDNAGRFYFGGASGATLAWDGTDLYGTDGTNVQWYARASTGKLYAGGGDITLSAGGIDVLADSADYGSNENYIQWRESLPSGTVWGFLGYGFGSTAVGYMRINGSGIKNTAPEICMLYDNSAGTGLNWIQINTSTVKLLGSLTVDPSGYLAVNDIRAYYPGTLTLQDDGGNVGLTVADGGVVGLSQSETTHLRTKRYAFYNSSVASGGVLLRITPGANYMAAHVRIVYVERPGAGASPLSTECTFGLLRMANAAATYGSAIRTDTSGRKIAMTVDTTNGRWDFRLQTDGGSNVAAGSYNTVMVEIEYSYSSVDWGVTVEYAP